MCFFDVVEGVVYVLDEFGYGDFVFVLWFEVDEVYVDVFVGIDEVEIGYL